MAAAHPSVAWPERLRALHCIMVHAFAAAFKRCPGMLGAQIRAKIGACDSEPDGNGAAAIYGFDFM
jgi:hypothetical protein